MKKTFYLLFLTGLFFSLPGVTNAQNFKKIRGEWTFNVPQAEDGYQSGTVRFAEGESENKGEVIFKDSGYTVELFDILYKKGELTFSLYLDTELIKVRMVLEDSVLTGTVTLAYSGTVMDITAER